MPTLENIYVSLLPVGITASVTLLVVLIAHKLTHLRAKNELLAKKAEETYMCLLQVRALGVEIIRVGSNSPFYEKASELFEEIERLEMLAILYFPEAEEYVKEIVFSVSHLDEDSFPYNASGHEAYDKRTRYLFSNAALIRNILQSHARKIA